MHTCALASSIATFLLASSSLLGSMVMANRAFDWVYCRLNEKETDDDHEKEILTVIILQSHSADIGIPTTT